MLKHKRKTFKDYLVILGEVVIWLTRVIKLNQLIYPIILKLLVR